MGFSKLENTRRESFMKELLKDDFESLNFYQIENKRKDKFSQI